MTDAVPGIVLASASPRRRELLAQIGVAHRVLAVDLDEQQRPGEAPDALACRLARDKALAGYRRDGARVPALGADTVVVLDGEVLGKPRDLEHGVDMLCRLGGREHVVLTAVALAWGVSAMPRVEVRLSASRVTLRAVTADEARRYGATGEPADKAGGYAIQGRGAVFVSALTGSYSGVMGLPLYETAELLALAGAAPDWSAGP